MRRSLRRWTATLLLAPLMAWTLSGIAAAPVSVPEPLRDWQAWALHGQEFRACPFLATRQPGNPGSHVCAWPGPLTLNLDADGGTFSQRWQVQVDSWVRLPGSIEHWPRDLRLNGSAAPVVAREGVPQLRLGPGMHEVSGRFAWSNRPEELPVPLQTAIIDLTLDGRTVDQPERPGSAVWLGQRRAAVEREALDLRVYRLLRDDIPARLFTRVMLDVAGAGREVLIGPVLPAGFLPLALEGDLPARLENDGRLRVQLRPGRFELMLEARGTSIAATPARPEAAAPWPADEVWSFQGVNHLRVAAAEGAESIDPAQADVPAEWHDHPAFRLPAGAALSVVERSRALANPDDNRLNLQRHVWLDFNHDGYTIADALGGRLNRDWRLDMAPPYLLEAASIDESNLLITAGDGEASGVELRDVDLNLSTISRVERPRAALPATGWSTRFENAEGFLHLPPGHRLLAAPGTDFAYGSWIDGWGLWNLFGVLVVIVLTHWVAGRIVAAAAAIALVLLYQEAPQAIWLWVAVIAGIALFRAAPEGRLRRFAGTYRIASFVVLALALLPLLIGQLRLAIYPQLDAGYSSFGFGGAAGIAMPANIKAEIIEPSQDMMRDQAMNEPAPAAPPPVRMEIGASGSDESEMQEVMVTGSRIQYASVSDRYAPGTLLQAGPGKPAWDYITYRYGWSGPVDPEQSVRFVWLGPVALGLWRILGVLATVLFALLLARATFHFRLDMPGMPAALRRRLAGGAAAGAAMLALGGALALAPVQPAQAQGFPTTEMLNELRTRLTETPSCRPSCAEIVAASVRANGARLDVDLNVTALADVAVALPQAGDRWQLDRVEVDGRAAPFAMRESEASAWLPLTRGAHVIRLSGRLANAETVQLGFPQPPRAISVSTNGWDASGLSNGRLLSGSLELIRRRAAGSAASALAPSQFAPFVQVTRIFRLDLDWSMTTIVERVAPRAAPLQVQIPLIPGESVTTDGAEIQGGAITVALPRGEERYEWHSLLARSESLALTLPADAARSEQWQLAVGREWHLQFEGFPPSLPQQGGVYGTWVYRFFPRAGETLNLTITRPAPVAGRTLAIDSARHHSQIGKRSITGSLELGYRSTQGGQHILTLPPELRVTEVLIDGEPSPVRPEEGRLPLTLQNGSHQVHINWTSPRGAGLLTRPDAIDLGTPASNVSTHVTLPADRWELAAWGPGVGTTVLYWGELLVFLLVAFALSRWSRSPLRFYQWLLLGLGLSTLSWPVFATVAAWLIVLRWRAGWQHEPVKRWQFQLVQVALAAFTLFAVTSLVFSGIRYGLLADPDMSVQAPSGAYGGDFNWFLDRSAATLPTPAIFSVPMWVYRLLMFAWAAWIAVELRRWLPAAWQAWTAGGFWRGKVVAQARGPA